MSEIWKDVVGWQDKYKVSDEGRVWNKISDKEVSQVLTGNPQYKYVNLGYKGIRKLRRVHILVAEAFIPNPENKKFVDHINRDKLDNRLNNLRWATHGENQRNTSSNVYMKGELLLDFVKRYDEPENAYSYLFTSLNNGMSEDEALLKYDTYKIYGQRQQKVEWEGNDIYLIDLCEKYNLDYNTTRLRIYSGWGIWNVVYNISPNYHTSFVVQDLKGVGHWYANNVMFEKNHPGCLLSYKSLLKQGKKLEEILAYDGKEHLRQWVLGVYGTIKELCEHFEVSERAVLTNMQKKGMTLEEAISTPRKRVKRMSINGVYNSPKYWYESFGIDARKANAKKSEKGFSFKETFEYYGVDTSNMIISLN